MPKELTLRGLVLGALLTLVFTAANVYLGLKVGLTFASSIPAAVISMAVLSAVRDSSMRAVSRWMNSWKLRVTRARSPVAKRSITRPVNVAFANDDSSAA